MQAYKSQGRCCLDQLLQFSQPGCHCRQEHDVAIAEWQAARLGAYCKRLTGNAPYHTPLMQDAVDELHGFLRQCSIAPPQFPVISNVSTQPYTKYSIIENLLMQLCMPVQWQKNIQYIKKQNVNILIELGSGRILTRILQKSEPDLHVFSYESTEMRSELNSFMPLRRGAGA
ncbi:MULTISPECIES: ACP S-malonyltransferase [unclassified Paenibacillus]|uniref:ACP S-malonyltransferase n=1 Tax=unclassified Paenibacillus TaxID=185978 RepID=UPI0009A8496F|nr:MULTISPECIES: ACP S-malonyltransferase [unclassified Paenibacillus]